MRCGAMLLKNDLSKTAAEICAKIPPPVEITGQKAIAALCPINLSLALSLGLCKVLEIFD